MERLAWRGVVRVILPRMMVPTSGRRGPEDRVIDRVSAFVDLVVEGVEIRGPAILAKSWEPWMCVAGPTLLELVGPSTCPGRAIDEVDILLVILNSKATSPLSHFRLDK